MPFGRVASAVAPHLPLRSRWRAKSRRSAVDKCGRLFRALARAGPQVVTLVSGHAIGRRYSIAHAHQTRISAEFQEPDGLLPLAGSNLLTRANASML